MNSINLKALGGDTCMTASENAKLLKWIHDARAFIEYATQKGMDNTAILHNLAHDIYGLADGDELMLPRVSGYAKAHPWVANDMTGEVTGSSRGALLPLLNNKNYKTIPALLRK